MNFFDDNFLEFKPKSLCSAWVATAIVGSAVIGAGASLYGASKAADAQKEAAATGTAAQTEQARIAAEAQTRASELANSRLETQYNTTRADLAPYRATGTAASDQLTNRLGDLTSPVGFNAPDVPKAMTQKELEATPGYQFTRTQGLKAVQNSAAARGLGVSGAALKGASTFATGLADQTYLDQFGVRQKLYEDAFQNAGADYTARVASQSNAFNRLKGLIDTGTNAAAAGGIVGTKLATDIAGNTVGIGNAQAAAANTAGTAASNAATTSGNAEAAFDNRIGSSISKASSDIGGYMAYKSLYGPKTPAGPYPSQGFNMGGQV